MRTVQVRSQSSDSAGNPEYFSRIVVLENTGHKSTYGEKRPKSATAREM